MTKWREYSLNGVLGCLILLSGVLDMRDLHAQTPAGRPDSWAQLELLSPLWAGQDSQMVAHNREVLILGLLDGTLRGLAQDARRERHVGGYVLLGLGAGSILTGAILLAGDYDRERDSGAFFLGGGVLLGGLSLIPFYVASDAERIYQDFSDQTDRTAEEKQVKRLYGEQRFRELAAKQRRRRLINGTTSIAAGLVNFVILDQEEAGYGTIPLFVGGLVTLFLESDEEREYKAYQQAKQDLLSTRGHPLPHFAFLRHSEGGWLGLMQIRF